MYNILLITNNNIIKNAFSEYFSGNAFYNVTINAKDLNLVNYDVLVIDHDLYDKYEYLFNNKEVNIKTFLLTDNKYNFNSFTNNYNILYPIFKPVCMEYFEHVLNGIFNNYNDNIDKYRYEIIRLFKELGLSQKLYGTRILYDLLIEIMAYNMDINIKLYCYLSIKYKKSYYCIEKNIRYAIKSSFNKKGNDELKNRLFGYIVDYDNGTISNLSFIYDIIPEIKYNLYKKELVLKD